MKILITKLNNWISDLRRSIAVQSQLKPNYLLIKVSQKKLF